MEISNIEKEAEIKRLKESLLESENTVSKSNVRILICSLIPDLWVISIAAELYLLGKSIGGCHFTRVYLNVYL